HVRPHAVVLRHLQSGADRELPDQLHRVCDRRLGHHGGRLHRATRQRPLGLDRGGKAIFNSTGAAAASIGATLANSTAGGSFSPEWPDIVANLRIDQAWGSAGISGAIHDVSASYYGASTATGHPSNETGYALGAGARFNLPMLGKGDHVGVEFDYANGAGQYTNYNLTTSGGVGLFDGGSVAVGWNPD